MKNMKVSRKLILAFSIVIVLSITVGVIGIVGMSRINAADRDLYTYNVIALDSLGAIRENYASQRTIMRNLVIYRGGTQQFNSAVSELRRLESEMKGYIDTYTPTMNTQQDKDLFNSFLSYYNNDYQRVKTDLENYGTANEQEKAMETLDGYGAVAASNIVDILLQSYNYNVEAAKTAVDNNGSLFSFMTFLEISFLSVAVVAAIILALFISRIISKPLVFLTSFMQRAGTTGNISLSKDDNDNISAYAVAEDETGLCIKSFSQFVKRLLDLAAILESVAAGDLTKNVSLLSDSDSMGLSLQKMMANLNSMFSEIHSSAAQVSIGSKQISDGSQALAQGSTEQASAVEQLSGAISEIANKTMENADMAEKAAKLAASIRESAEKGSRQMDEMMGAVKDINQASQSINKVIKAIDDIAFQTNILALNAAVEAARAGQHGKGFAVVAEEVRNLAAKSAEAAKDTESLIANSIEKAELGANIAEDTAASLSEIVSGINQSSQLVSDIAKSSEEQSLGVSEINKGIDQVAQVIQQNSATAQQSAAASQEMTGQADMLESLIAQFKIKESSSMPGSRSFVQNGLPPAPPSFASPASRNPAAPPSPSGFGKY